MASFLRPRRGNRSASQSLILKRGEIFFDIDDGGLSTGSGANATGKIKMGNGSTIYSQLGYFIDVDTSVVEFTDTTSTATSTNQGADYYAYLNGITSNAQIKTVFTNFKRLLYNLATNITTLNKKIPFNFGVDSNNEYGYIKEGTNVVVPFVAPPSGNINLGTYIINGSKSADVSGYATCSFTVNIPEPSGTLNYICRSPNPSTVDIDVTNYEYCNVSVNYSSFTWTTLWTNPSPTSSFANQEVTLNHNWSDYTLLKITWMNSTSDQTEHSKIVMVDDVENYQSSSAAAGTHNASIGCYYYKASGGKHNYVRSFCPAWGNLEPYKYISFGNARVLGTTTDNNKPALLIPYKIYGGKVN